MDYTTSRLREEFPPRIIQIDFSSPLMVDSQFTFLSFRSVVAMIGNLCVNLT